MARVLIADRDEAIAKLLEAAICRLLECQVVRAHHTSSAREALQTQTFDLALLDIGRYSDGLETLKQIRGRNEECAVIALTTGVIQAALLKTLAAADVYAAVSKPFDLR